MEMAYASLIVREKQKQSPKIKNLPPLRHGGHREKRLFTSTLLVFARSAATRQPHQSKPKIQNQRPPQSLKDTKDLYPQLEHYDFSPREAAC